jgi:hypothetical protein
MERAVERRPADMRAWWLIVDAEESPGSGDAFEFVFALVEEFDVGACDEVGDGS